MRKQVQAVSNNTAPMEDLAVKLNISAAGLPLLKQALTHPTYFEGLKDAVHDNNQRLEFLGDAVLGLVIGEYLFVKYPQHQEGDLTKMRSVLVCEGALAKKADKFNLGRYLYLGRGGESNGDRRRPSVLADAFEAVLGALYLDGGLATAKKFLLENFSDDIADLQEQDYEDSKSSLQEYVQQFGEENVSYRLLGSTGPSHEKTFVSGVYFAGSLLAKGKGGSKKESQQRAAKFALTNKELWENLLHK